MHATLLPADQQFFADLLSGLVLNPQQTWGESGLLNVARLTLSEA